MMARPPHQFHRAVAATGAGRPVGLGHLPYQLDPDGSAEPRPPMETMAAGMIRLGVDEGLEHRFDRAVSVSTFAAHRLLWLALRDRGPGSQASLAGTLHEAHFRDGGSVADHAELAGLAGRVAAAKRDGVNSVPTFVSEDGQMRGIEAILDDLARAFYSTDERSRSWTG